MYSSRSTIWACSRLATLARDEDAEMADTLVHQADDDLPVGLEVFRRGVEVRDPVEGLLRRGDVVAERGEQDDGRADGPQVEGVPSGPFGAAGGELVADEQVVDDPLDLLPVHQEVAAPPALEFQKALGLGVDLGEKIVVLVEERVRRVQGLEVLDQIGPVELAAAKIARQQRGPDPAEHAAGVAHRVLGIVAGPVGHRARR